MSRLNDDFAVLHDAAGANGDGLILGIDGRNGQFVVLQVTEIGSGTLTPQGSVDGINWAGVQVTALATGSASSTITTTGLYRLDARGIGGVRVPLSGWSTGAVTLKARAQQG